ncbi:MAG: DUF2470 domain-containing protein [Bacteroidota bacterium]
MESIEFKQKFVTNAVEHMNDDHRDAMIDILQAFCDADWVVDAEMLHFDREKIKIRGLGEADKTADFEVAYDQPLTTAKEFRPVLIGMLKQARAMKKND